MDTQLKRRIGPVLLTAYGVGVMVGAGIYVLVGAVAGAAGVWAPLAFLLAGLVALPSALSYAEFSTRYPEAAGEVAYVQAGYNSRLIGIITGLAVVLAGTISAAAVLRGGVGYLTSIVEVSPMTAIVTGGVVLTGIAIIGVVQSLAVAAILTVIEVAGLALVIWAGFSADPVAAWQAPPAMNIGAVFGAVALCFFAFIGFEDMVNMSEEVSDPTRTMPRAILVALLITAVLYALVTLAAVRAVPQDVLANSDQPLALVWQNGTGQAPQFLSAIAVAAAINGVLAQIVMAARILFGLGKRTKALAVFKVASPRLGTPVAGSLVVGAGVVLAALLLPVAQLAEATATVLLVVFVLVNLALILVKRGQPDAPFRISAWVPYAGLFAALAALVASLVGGGA